MKGQTGARVVRRALMLAIASVCALPGAAYAAEASVVVPGWLTLASAGVGLLTAVVALVYSELLRRVSDGSMIADNIVYIMLAVICLSVSMLLRWFSAFVTDDSLVRFIALGADLLVTAALALVATYLGRMGSALKRYLKSVQAYAASVSEQDE